MIKFLVLNYNKKVFTRRRISDYFILYLSSKNKDKAILNFKSYNFFEEYYYITYGNEKILKIDYKEIKNLKILKIKKEENTSFNL